MTMQTVSSLHVQPGDVIASALINQILDRLDTLTTQVNGVGLQLGSLAVQTHTLVALGSGFDTGGIFLDGQSLLIGPPQRGINLVILDSNLQLKFRSAYDTFASTPASTQLATDIAAHTARFDVVIGVTHDAYVPGNTAHLPDPARTALASIGASSLGTPDRGRDNAAFIGVVPNNRGNVTFDYLVSTVPADDSGFGGALLAAPPFAWGVYSVALHRFLIGGGAIPELWTAHGVAATQTQTQTQTQPTVTAPVGVIRRPVTTPVILAPPGTTLTLSLRPSPITPNATASGTVTLSAAAPTGGVTVSIQSSEPTIVSVPQNVAVAENQTAATFSANALKAGSSVITANAPGAAAPATFTLVVSG